MKRQRVERGIYKQANGTYGVYLLVDGKPRYQTVGNKLAEARRQRDQLSAQAQTGQLAPPSRLTFAQLSETWLRDFESLVLAGERAERTLEYYTYALDTHLLPALGHKRLQAITTDDIADLIATLRGKGLAAKTINGSLVPLGRILKHALRRGHITTNPLDRLEQHERPRNARREQRVLNHDEISRLLDASLPRYRTFLATAIYTGMRLSELLGLTWADIDLDQQLIHVRYQLSRARHDRPARRVPLKTRAATRDIPLPPQLAALLRRHKLASRYSAERDYVFASATGTPLQGRNVERRGLTQAADKAGLNPEGQPRLRVHDLRHTYASHLIIDLHLDIPQVSRILGHARPSITLDTYTHLYNHATHTQNIRDRLAASAFANLL